MIEDSLRTQLLTKSAVTAIVGSGSSARIRPYKLWQKDDLRNGPAIIIKVNEERDENDLECEAGIVIADVSVISIAQEAEDARALSRAVKVNGTNPGTGLAHGEWTISGSLKVRSCCYINTLYDFATYNDDSDEGFYFADSHYTVIFDETV